MNHKPYGSYEKYFKRLLDIVCSLAAIIVFSWLYIILIILGAIFMRGNPFFTQERPGKDEKIFKLIKFRSMDNRKDKNGNLLPDEVRLNKYGQFLRKTSLDELPEAFNILKGDMSIIGPRPLLVSYLPWYTEEEKQRHDVRPGLSGLAQVNGRNSVTWEEKFSYVLCGDNQYRKEYGVQPEQILAALTGFYRGNQYIDCEKNKKYKQYVKLWCSPLFPRRCAVWAVKAVMKIRSRASKR